jgi:hypothetical protein
MREDPKEKKHRSKGIGEGQDSILTPLEDKAVVGVVTRHQRCDKGGIEL